MPAGRPTDYKPEYIEQAQKLTKLGATDREVAEFFDVSEATLNNWKHSHPEFLESLKLGKEAADSRVEKSLYRRAVGYSFDSEKLMTVSLGNSAGSEIQREHIVEHVPPDVTACIFWLKNRRRAEWRDEQRLQVEDVTTLTPEERTQRLAKLVAGTVEQTKH